MFEPWVEGNVTSDLARRSTLNELRRTVTVELLRVPHFELNESLSGARRQAPPETDAPDSYALVVTVTLERRQAPDRYLTHSARGQIAASYRDVPAHLAQRGIPAEYWEAAGEDPSLAERLLTRIGNLAAIPQTRGEFLSYDDDPGE
ncbi:hypothetical protein OT109_11160 [Phycisphaeraceae bacterium D3-23]